jgi:micrococcal nuclease
VLFFLLLSNLVIWFFVLTHLNNNNTIELVKVVKVIDGDTFEGIKKGTTKVERFRLLGIDTPESVHPDKKVECYSIEAKIWLKNNIEDKIVEVSYSNKNEKDLYGRNLVYVTSKNRIMNLELIKYGLAKKLIWEFNERYSKEITELELSAKQEKVGLWKFCD